MFQSKVCSNFTSTPCKLYPDHLSDYGTAFEKCVYPIRKTPFHFCWPLTNCRLIQQHFSPQNTLRTPVYTTSLRSNAMGVGLVFLADLDIREHESHWILQGVCLTLNTDWCTRSACRYVYRKFHWLWSKLLLV